MEESKNKDSSWCPFSSSSCRNSECRLWNESEETCAVCVMSDSLTQINKGIESMKAYQRRWGRFMY